jgi:urate oxidase
MARLEDNTWGKTGILVSKLDRSSDGDDFIEIEVQVLLEGDVAEAHTIGDNRGVVPTDTMKNTVYGLAQDHLDQDLESFAGTLAGHFLTHQGVDRAIVTVSSLSWLRVGPTGFVADGEERRLARVTKSESTEEVRAGVSGLTVLKTTGSSFTGFPRDRFTVLLEADDRLLATSITAEWRYSTTPGDTTQTWQLARQTLIDHFFGDPSGSVQHQGFLMAQALLAAVREIEEVEFRLPNRHHLPFDLTRFGIEDRGIVFQPVSEPFGDIRFRVTRGDNA